MGINVYFVRHGESKGNRDQVHQGENIPLSEKGKRQAELIAGRLKETGIDIIYSSPYLRAKQTARTIAKKLNLKIEYWDELKERKNPSELEGLSYSDPKALGIKRIIKKNELKPNWRFSDEEGFNEVLARAKRVKEYLLQQREAQNILCVSHVKIIFMIILNTLFQDKLTPEVFWQFYYHSRLMNTGITHLEFKEESGWSLVTWNDVTHL